MLLKAMSLLLSVAIGFAAITLPADASRRDYMQDAPLEAIKKNPGDYAADYIKPVAMNGGTFGRLPEVKSLGKVAVTGFQVMFQTQRKVHTEGSTLKGITAGQWTDARWQVDVNGLTPELMQEITEAAYAEFVKDLEEAGYEVIPQETLKANAEYQDLLRESEEKNVETSGLTTQRMVDRLFKHEIFTTVVPNGLPLQETDASLNPFKTIGQTKQVGRLMESLGGANLVNAVYYLNTEKLTKINSLWLVKKSENDKVFGLSVARNSRVDFIPYNKKYNPGKYASYTVKFPVQETEPVGIGKGGKENYGTQALAVGLAALGARGVPGVVRLRKYELDIEPEAYKTTSLNLLDATNELIFASLK